MRRIFLHLIFFIVIFVKPHYPVYLYSCKFLYVKAFAAVVAYFIGIEVARFAFHAPYAFPVV